MSIVAYVGLPRSGKSHGVVENVILPALEAGRTVITNIPVKLGRLADDYPGGKVVQFSVKEPFDDKWKEHRETVDDRGRKKNELVSNYWDIEKHPHGAVWVIDEAWRYWKSGTKASQVLEREMQFFTEHGHCVGEDGKTTEIVLVTQDLQQMASCIRDLVEETYKAVKLTTVGQSKRYRVDVFHGPVKLSQNSKPLRTLFGKYKPEVYQYYKSHTHNKTDFAAGMEEKVDDRGNVLKSPMIKFGLPIALLVMAYCVYTVYGFVWGDTPESDPPPAEQQPVRAENAVMVENGQVKKPARARKASLQDHPQGRWEIEQDWLPVSDKWRIVGEVNEVYWLWGETGTRKIHSRICRKTLRTGEPYCIIEGKRVTYYSYKDPQRERDNRRDYTSGVSDSFN